VAGKQVAALVRWIFEFLQQAADESALLAETVAQASLVGSAYLSDRLAEMYELLESGPQP
jgi:hypothetical protein